MKWYTFSAFDMNTSDLKHPETRLEEDESGYLYDARLRALAGEGPGVRRDAFEMLSALAWAAKRMHQARERWAEAHGLSEGRLYVLFRLRRDPDGVPLGELAEALRVTPRNITGLIDNLERAGLVTRVPDASDRRSVLARLTDRGRERIDALWRTTLDAQARLAEEFTPQEMAQLRHLCLRLARRLEAESRP
jgi:DNA-binding MarR family transcriptional regulator